MQDQSNLVGQGFAYTFAMVIHQHVSLMSTWLFGILFHVFAFVHVVLIQREGLNSVCPSLIVSGKLTKTETFCFITAAPQVCGILPVPPAAGLSRFSKCPVLSVSQPTSACLAPSASWSWLVGDTFAFLCALINLIFYRSNAFFKKSWVNTTSS